MLSRLSVLVCSIALFTSCGGSSSSPTAPSSSAPATKIIGISGSLAFGDVIVGQSRDSTITISNSGTAALTFTGITATGGLTAQSAATPTSGTVPPGGSLQVLFRFTPTTTGAFSGTVTITSDHTSGTNTIQMSGTGVGVPITVVGVITDSATRAALGGVRVSALTPALTTTIAATTTDGNGFYSMVVPSATALNMNYTLNGYNIQNVANTFTADSRRDISLVRSAPAAAALEYRVSGTGAATSAGLTYENCSHGTSQQSDAQLPWSFTCSSFPTGDFVYISAQNNRNSGCVKVQIFKRGTLYRESESCGAFVIATASGSY